MNKEELEKRQERAKTENFIIAKTDDGFRVCSPLTPANQYLVVGSNEGMTCTCPDFQHHANDPEWRCKHVLAVQNHLLKQSHHSAGDNAGDTKENRVSPPPPQPAEAKKASARGNGGAQMLIKRSVSPDGRIDSLSVEFSCPVGKTTTEEIKQRAERTLKLQAEIVEGFRKANGKPPQPSKGTGNGQNTSGGHGSSSSGNGAVAAQLLSVGGMNGKWGRRLFINVLADNQVLKLFGSEKQLGEALTAAGYPSIANQVREGLALNLACEVVTKPTPDGKYVNVERVLPIPAHNKG